MKKILSLAFLVVISLSAHPQHFDWIKSYSAPEPSNSPFNYIISSVTDSHGNLYVAGLFAYGASIDGEELLPSIPEINSARYLNGCIIKFSPEGDILWKKILHSNISPCQPYTLQIIGDTALYAFVIHPTPTYGDDYLYFYDTLITPSNVNDLINIDSFYYSAGTTAISIFDLDGNLNEHYILNMAYKDSENRLITMDMLTNNDFDSVYIYNAQFKPGFFSVDKYGNIYFGHLTTDLVDVYSDTAQYNSRILTFGNGQLSEFVILVNGKQKFHHAPIGNPAMYNLRIMKFSPHFSDLLICRNVFTDDTVSWTTNLILPQLLADTNSDRVYLLHGIEDPSALTSISLQGDTSKHVLLTTYIQSFLIEYNDSLIPLDIIQISPEHIPPRIFNTAVEFKKVLSSKDSNALFIIGVYENHDVEYTPTYNGQPLDLGDATMNAFILRLNRDNHSLEYYNHIRSSQGTTFVTYRNNVGLTEWNGRIFAQAMYQGNVEWADTSINIYQWNLGAGIFSWDYMLNELDFIDLNLELYEVIVASELSIHDSSLYISLSSKVGFTLNNTTIPISGNSVAVITKYVDRKFSIPYSPNSDIHESIESVKPVSIKCYPNPTNSSVIIELSEDEQIYKCNLVSSNGIQLYESITNKKLDLSNYPSGIYYLEITTNKNTYKQKILKL